MFRIGGSAGTGITSGLDQPQKMANGGRTGYQQGSMPSFQTAGLPGFLTSFGLNLLATPPAGNIFQTAGMAAREPFNQLQASQAKQRQLQAEKDFIRSERLEGQKFEEDLLDKRLTVEKMKINAGDNITVQQLAAQYLDDFQGDLNKATNKAKFFLEVRPLLANEATGVGETQIGGLIEVDLTNEKQAKTFATRNRNKVGKVFYDLNTGKLVKLVKDPETRKLGFVDYILGSGTGPDTEGESMENTERKIDSPGLYGQEPKPPKKLKEVLPDIRDSEFDEDLYQM